MVDGTDTGAMPASSGIAGIASIVDATGNRTLPIGIESFEDVVGDYVYIDKTLLVKDLIRRGGVTLFCRPRRFGKSLTMRMLQCFFETPVEGYIANRRNLFENLAIWSAGDQCRREQGAHPVIYLNLASVDGQSWNEALASIAQVVAAEYVRHRYLFETSTDAGETLGGLSRFERPAFERLAMGTASVAELKASLARLSTQLRRYHGTKTVILIDEYDKPITAGFLGGWHDEVVNFMRSWLSDALKGTVDLRLACLTGVQRVSRESIFSDLNNLIVDTPLDTRFDESFGFTETEALALADYMGSTASCAEMKRWYDGYTFGNTRVYNPLSTLRYLLDGVAQPYWTNTGGNAVIARLFQRADCATDAGLRTLAEGGEVRERLDMQVVFGEIESDTGAVWSQLYLAGYLTTDDTTKPEDFSCMRRLRVPNLEVRKLFRREFSERAQRLAGPARLRGLHTALLANDVQSFERELNRIVEESPSFRDLATEAPCHMLLMGMLYEVPGYRYPVSNRESGLGYSDIVLEPLNDKQGQLPVIAIEVKRARTAAGSDVTDAAELTRHARDVALRQAVEKRYGTGFDGNGRVLWGVSFSGKRVACAMERA